MVATARVHLLYAAGARQRGKLTLGVAPLISSPDQFAARLKADMAKFAKVIKAANIKIE